MFCKRCGKDIGNAGFCRNCGMDMRAYQNTTFSNQQPTKKKKAPFVIAGIAGVAILIIVFGIMVTFFSFIFNKNKNDTPQDPSYDVVEEQKPDQTVDDVTTKVKEENSETSMDLVMEEYQTIIREQLSECDEEYVNDYCGVGLAYIDEDNIPELIISAGSFHGASPMVFTYCDGAAVQLEGLGSHFGEFYYEPESGWVVASYFGNGGYMTAVIYQIENGYAVQQIKLFHTNDADNQGTTYEVNDVATSKEDFRNRANEYMSQHSFKVLRHDDLINISMDQIDSFAYNYTDYMVEGIEDVGFDELIGVL